MITDVSNGGNSSNEVPSTQMCEDDNWGYLAQGWISLFIQHENGVYI